MTALSPSNAARWSPAAAVLAAVAVVLPLLGVVAPLGLAPLLAAAALALIALDWRGALGVFREFTGAAALLAALSLWGMLSALWSILPAHSFLEGLRLLAINAGGLVCLGAARALAPPDRRRLGVAALVGVALATALLITARFIDLDLFQAMLSRAQDAPLTRFDRGSTVLVLALWPALVACRTRKFLAIALGLAAATAVLSMISTAAKLALVVGLVLLAAAYWRPRVVAGALAAGLVAISVLLPLATPAPDQVVAIHRAASWLKPSAIHRLLIWRFAVARFAERPLLGWGMDASRELPGAHQSLAELVPGSDMPAFAEQLSLHPHNAVLQWEVELGLPGAALCLGIIAWSLMRAGRQEALGPFHLATELAWAGSALVIALLSYGAWQAWWLSGLWLTAALCTAVRMDRAASGSPAKG
jgi:exopolysaccharide production protein ExoQ